MNLTPFSLDEGLSAIADFRSFVGTSFFDQTAKQFTHQMRAAVHNLDRLRRSEALHPLATAFSDYLRAAEQLRSGIVPVPTAALLRLAGDSIVLFEWSSVWDDGEHGRRRRTLLKRIKDPHEALRCLYEFRMAKSLQVRGLDVEVRSALVLPGSDLQVRWGDFTVDVECKYSHSWSGRRIRNSDFNRLFHILGSEVDKPGYPAAVVSLICQDRLPEDIRAICSASRRLMLGPQAQARCVLGNENVGVTIMGAKPHRVPTSELESYVDKIVQSVPHAHIGILGQMEGENAVLSLVLVGQSRTADDVVGYILQVAQTAATQMGSPNPTIVTIHIQDAFQDLGKPPEDWPLTKEFRSWCEKGKLRKLSLLWLTFDNPRVEGNAVILGGALVGLRNPHCDVSIPDGFPR